MYYACDCDTFTSHTNNDKALTMKTLSSQDAFFLYYETPDQHQHTLGTLLLDPSTAPEHCDIETLVNRLHQSVAVKPAFTQKLVDTVFSMTYPVLVDDPDFRYENHIHRIAVPAPGTTRELAGLVEDIASTPLDRRHPLWGAWFISGLEGGRLALVIKIHHCLNDAAKGSEMMADLFDTEPVSPPSDYQHEAKTATELPPRWKINYQALKSRWNRDGGYVDVARRTVRSLQKRRNLFANSKKINELVPAYLESAPKLKFNGAISSNRCAALGSLSLTDVKMIKNVLGVTVNDVVLMACTMALRDYLVANDDLPDAPLIGYVPVSLSLRGERAENQDQGNQLGAMSIRLPVQLDDPEQMITAIHESSVAAKEVFEAAFENLFQRLVGALPPRLAERALKLAASQAVIDRLPISCNTVISNIPFSPKPLYIAGAKVEATFPMGPVITGQGPNFTFMSYADKFNFSVQACREHLPDPWILADGIIAAVDTLAELARQKQGEIKPKAKAKAKSKAKPKRKAAAGN